MQDNLNLHFNRAYKTQGSVITNTNIKVHSDFDLLTIIDRYHYNQPGVENSSDYTESNPDDDILELRTQSTKIMKNIYDEVDTSGKKGISIFNKSLNRKVDIVFCFWYHSKKYIETKDEHYKGIYLYEFPVKRKILDYPFAHINNVNYKGDTTNDGARKGIRLLKNLKADADSKIDLTSFHLTTIVHSIEDNHLNYNLGNELLIAKSISDKMNILINDPARRKEVKSPNGTENPLEDDKVVPEIKKIKEDLDTLIIDTAKELNSPTVKRILLNY
ncbi:hypothetical protein SAMN04488519_1177 [Algoriphagus ornithinivorans]|uniref:Nucleotidyltransferase n=1 Tax=Algoriphagus ornithinivorans TaxID=226506 RepID=A0A1I5K3N2_9BACT|nr:hypothetical protein [Algoriphagus ornithinivorans]SFO79682.1 hypothetical protein SAMN04488519_1177 [Algoriphagus ornithinivorans]